MTIAGCVLLSIGLLTCIPSCYCYCNQIQSTQPLIAALEEESNKYQSQHCQWRLIEKKDDPSFFVSRRHQILKYHVSVIHHIEDKVFLFIFDLDNY